MAVCGALPATSRTQPMGGEGKQTASTGSPAATSIIDRGHQRIPELPDVGLLAQRAGVRRVDERGIGYASITGRITRHSRMSSARCGSAMPAVALIILATTFASG